MVLPGHDGAERGGGMLVLRAQQRRATEFRAADLAAVEVLALAAAYVPAAEDLGREQRPVTVVGCVLDGVEPRRLAEQVRAARVEIERV
ncbi:hypothetical protein D5044_05835 [Verminephrobacter eiseniae]|nr:hypothetical protein [Verminephrobacter eiseniae]